MRQLTGADAEGRRAQAAMGAGMAVATDNEAARQAQSQFGPDDMDDALAGLVEVEQPDAGSGGFAPQSRQQFLPNLDRAGTPARRRNRVVGRCKRQIRLVKRESADMYV